VEGGRAARQRPCGCEPLAGLASVPAALVLAGSAFCGDGDSGQKRRTQDRGFAKSEHMTRSRISSALVEWTLTVPLIIWSGLNRPFWIA
jgi:hypothetical protein